MVELDNIDIFYKTFFYFASNILPDLPNDDKIWTQVYMDWLKQQGATVVKTKRNAQVNGLGVAPGYDRLYFENDHDKILFIMRWS